MRCKPIIFVLLLLFGAPVFAAPKIIAIDGVSGYVGSTLSKELAGSNPRLGLHTAQNAVTPGANIFVGSICNPAYLKSLLKGVDVYYQMAAISAVNPQHTLEEYILTNSIAPYLASRINKSMTVIALSSITIHDVAETDALHHWTAKFITHVRSMFDNKQLTEAGLAQDLHAFMIANPPPQLRPTQYYGFSKILLEKLLFKSARTRTGHIYIIRPALIIGGEVCKHRGDGVVKNIMAALFTGRQRYDVWSRTNYYTPLSKVTAMMLYLANSEEQFAKFGIFDSGCVAMHQHAFVKKICNLSQMRTTNIRLVDEVGFDRQVLMFKDTRLEPYYPTQSDVDEAIADMVRLYQE